VEQLAVAMQAISWTQSSFVAKDQHYK